MVIQGLDGCERELLDTPRYACDQDLDVLKEEKNEFIDNVFVEIPGNRDSDTLSHLESNFRNIVITLKLIVVFKSIVPFWTA